MSGGQVRGDRAALDDARSRDAGGSGLGLAIVRAVARDHGAMVEVGDSPAGGARFRVTFPPSCNS